MKKIVIDLDSNLNLAIAQIEDLKKQIEEFPEVLAEGNRQTTQSEYDRYVAFIEGGTVGGYGKEPVTVEIQAEKNTASIHAMGEEVGFAEWGTGVTAVVDPDAPIPTGEGTWSKDHGQNLVDHEYWFYNGQKHFGSVATEAMTHTIERLRNDTESIAKDYFT